MTSPYSAADEAWCKAMDAAYAMEEAARRHGLHGESTELAKKAYEHHMEEYRSLTKSCSGQCKCFDESLYSLQSERIYDC